MSGNIYRRIMFQRNAVVSFTFYHMILVLFCIGLSLGVTIAVGILLYYQVQFDSNMNYQCTLKILFRIYKDYLLLYVTYLDNVHITYKSKTFIIITGIEGRYLN